ncbi:S8 family serine peptidase [Frankia sp. R82]|uniref:S8 family serine peptidase n=1 Tax=Frankia sp. R82 TaxID=2950553 RepID=UPI0020441D17|nr:S8 family serine peptidase [Frankia sp. R82]MCM3884000.1 S8 family serine peptidase [Frankia sp. R82]
MRQLPRSRSRSRGTAARRGALLAATLTVLTALIWPSLTWLTTPPVRAAMPGQDDTGSQWYQTALDLDRVQRISQGAGVIVAVVDGGVDATNPKLRGQLVRGAGVGPDAAADGWRDDDPDGHGTAMAGLVAGRVDGGPAQVRGIAPAARILPISTGAETDSAEVAIAVHRAVDLGAGVINLSLGSADDPTSDEREAVSYALAHDVVVVASAGNVEPGDPPSDAATINSPASIPGVVAVTGSTAGGGFWHGSVHGPQAVVAAPAPGIRAPVPTAISPDGLDTGSGTSNSAAIVSGVLALIRSARPDLDAANVIERLIRTARDAGPPGRDAEFGFGIIDPLAALTAAVPPVRTSSLLAPSDPPVTAASSGSAGTAGTAPSFDEPTSRWTDAVSLDGTPPLVAWVVAMVLAVWLGGLLGVGAHLAHQRRRAPGRTPAPPYPADVTPVVTGWVPASPGARSGHF